MKQAFFVSIPHSGERVPDFCKWLHGLSEPILMCDVDRFVDKLYEPVLSSLNIPTIKTEWHRYAADMNRVPEDIDADSVKGAKNPPGTHARGFHWVITTTETRLMKEPMSPEMHQELVQLIYEPFHKNIRNLYAKFKATGAGKVYHLDLHSMPGVGTNQHKDPGERRADIVVSDCKGKSADPAFVDLVITSYVRAGFKVAYNWPYVGGRVSEQYGNPASGQHCVQVELNRSLYMDEKTKQLRLDLAGPVGAKLREAIKRVQAGL